jgi:hypothetical protein
MLKVTSPAPLAIATGNAIYLPGMCFSSALCSCEYRFGMGSTAIKNTPGSSIANFINSGNSFVPISTIMDVVERGMLSKHVSPLEEG